MKLMTMRKSEKGERRSSEILDKNHRGNKTSSISKCPGNYQKRSRSKGRKGNEYGTIK